MTYMRMSHTNTFIYSIFSSHNRPHLGLYFSVIRYAHLSSAFLLYFILFTFTMVSEYAIMAPLLWNLVVNIDHMIPVVYKQSILPSYVNGRMTNIYVIFSIVWIHMSAVATALHYSQLLSLTCTILKHIH